MPPLVKGKTINYLKFFKKYDIIFIEKRKRGIKYGNNKEDF